MSTEYDYIVVGAGSAGCAVARRLSDLGAGRVLLLEAGVENTHPGIPDPTAWPSLWGTEVDWAYRTVAQDGTAQRVHDWPRGKVLGGTSCLNAMQFIRGHRSDFDGWAKQGNAGWDYDSVLPLMKEIEDFEGGADEYHGAGGPMHVATLRDKSANPVSEAFVEACVQTGYPTNDDLNGAVLEGAGWNPTNIKGGVRQDTWNALVAPVLDRGDITVRTGAHVRRLLIEGGRCTGVELLDGEQIRVTGEVIVSSGALESPRLLMLSGIGAAAELAEIGVDTVVDLPGVGKNLHDHLLLGVVYESKQPIPVGANNLSESVMFLRSDPALDGADIQLAAIHVPFHSAEFSAPANSYTIAPGIAQPKSRGTVRLTSSDPEAPLLVDPNYLGEDEDVAGLIKGIELTRAIGEAPAFDEWRLREVLPGPEVTTEAALREFVAKAASTYYHPVGTCAMGQGDDSVVDERLRVRGVTGLRVADASIMPTIVKTNPNNTIVTIGYKCADMVVQDAR
nr:GMC family oxidoreductase N-terminal domain-containing protein [uncultured Actinotalea sp.]